MIDGGTSLSMENGMKDEIFFVLQLVILFYSIFYSSVPFIGDALTFLSGPGLVLSGLSLLAIGMLELGRANLSPWIIPSSNENGTVVTNGVFGHFRHPMSAGLLYLMLGISIWSNNATRLILCAGLWHVLDITTNEEEMEMEKKFGMEYSNYRTKVKTKFIPERVVNALPLFKWYLTLPPI